MKKQIKKLSRFSFLKSWMLVSSLAIVAAASVGLYGMRGVSAASATLYTSPASSTYQVGQTVTLSIRENSGTDGVIAAQADFTYPSSLQYVSTSGNSSAFGI